MTLFKVSGFLTVIGAFTLVLNGCGSSNNAVPAPVATQPVQQQPYDPNNPNTPNNPNNPYPPGNEYYLGGYIKNPYGTPILNPDDASGPMAWQTNRPIRAGQRVTIAGVRGGWGTLHEKTRKVFFNIFKVTTWRLRCDEINTSGKDRDGHIVTFRGGPAGLYASDGATTYLVGEQGTSFIASRDGFLLLGYNMSNETDTCFRFSNYFSVRIY